MSNYRAELTGVFGDPVDDNPTGIMEEAAYREMGLNFRYLTVKVLPADLPAAIQGLRAFHMRGVNLTMPHKIQVLPLLDELTEAADMIGAVNTIINQDGRLIGENTDGKGFVRALQKRGVSPAGKVLTILGAGGAARAIAVECALAGAGVIHIINRTQSKGRELVALLNDKTGCRADYLVWTSGIAIPEDTNILINATSVGLKPHDGEQPDLDYDSIRSGMWVCDVVFNPVQPRFLQTARAHGAQTINGIGMLVQQGALNFTLWTGAAAPEELMYRILEKEFSVC